MKRKIKQRQLGGEDEGEYRREDKMKGRNRIRRKYDRGRKERGGERGGGGAGEQKIRSRETLSLKDRAENYGEVPDHDPSLNGTPYSTGFTMSSVLPSILQ